MTPNTRFDPERYYRPADPEMRLIATVGTLGFWRHVGKGPPYTKIAGRRVAYRGEDLNAWLDAQRIEPRETDPPPRRRRGPVRRRTRAEMDAATGATA